MATKFLVILSLFLVTFSSQEEKFLGDYFTCSIECIRKEHIYVEANKSLFATTAQHKPIGPQGKYLIGSWIVRDDSIIVLRITKDRKEAELEYIYKEHDKIKFLVSPAELHDWSNIIRVMDSVLKNDEMTEIIETANWQSLEKKNEMLKKLKVDAFERALFGNRPTRDIYIELETFTPTTRMNRKKRE